MRDSRTVEVSTVAEALRGRGDGIRPHPVARARRRGVAELEAHAVTVRCLQDADGEVPDQRGRARRDRPGGPGVLTLTRSRPAGPGSRLRPRPSRAYTATSGFRRAWALPTPFVWPRWTSTDRRPQEGMVSATTDRVLTVVEPVAARLGLRVYDVDQPGGTLRVMLDADGGVDIDTLAEASREISRRPRRGRAGRRLVHARGLEPRARASAAPPGALRRRGGRAGEGQADARHRGRPPLPTARLLVCDGDTSPSPPRRVTAPWRSPTSPGPPPSSSGHHPPSPKPSKVGRSPIRRSQSGARSGAGPDNRIQ